MEKASKVVVSKIKDGKVSVSEVHVPAGLSMREVYNLITPEDGSRYDILKSEFVD